MLGLDFDAEFVAIARAAASANVEFVTGDAYDTGLEAASFDLVHARFLACTAGEPERLIAEAARLARPGGVVALQDADWSSLNCSPPHPAWTALRAAGWALSRWPRASRWPTGSTGCCAGRGSRRWSTGRVVVGVRSGDPWQDYLPATVELLRGRVLERGLMPAEDFDATLAACRRHLADPDTVFTSYTVVQVWGRTSGPA